MRGKSDLELIEEHNKLIALLDNSDELSEEEREGIKRRIVEIWNELVESYRSDKL